MNGGLSRQPARTPALPDTQLFLRPGIIEMNWGNPAPELLPVDNKFIFRVVTTVN